jgi:hypothetical protein
MTKIEEIEQAVGSLSREEYRQFRAWFLERDWESWGQQIEADSYAGKLDFLLEEAAEEKHRGGAPIFVTHRARSRCWRLYSALPEGIRRSADNSFALVKADPAHPSLHFKKVGKLWSARIGT